MKIKRLGWFKLALRGLVFVALFIPIAISRPIKETCEYQPLIRFLRDLDPENALRIGRDSSRQNPCADNWKGLKCNSQGNKVVEIRVDKADLRGVLDANSLCKLSNLGAVSLAENRIRGPIPHSIAECKRLVYLNLSNNLLNGMIPRPLMRLKHIGKLDISNNHFHGSMLSNSNKSGSETNEDSNDQGDSQKGRSRIWIILLLVVFGIGIMLVIAYLGGKKLAKLAKKKANMISLEDSPTKTPLTLETVVGEEIKPEASTSELVFFVNEHERFTLDDLLEATADLRSHSACSTLYKVGLKNNMVYAVKRLKNLSLSLEDFGRTMREIGNVKHLNILPLVAYSSTPEDKLLIYKFQNNGSLLNLLQDYNEGKREFQWGLRLSIAGGIAKGLRFIYDNNNSNNKEIIPHGNIKLSNILLDETYEPLIAEFGYSKFLNPNAIALSFTKGYTAPEREFSEKSDVYSFGVVLLELLTGKAVEKTGLDLPKWVNAMVREEWTGEVFDKNLAKSETQWAFPMLNVALKCVSYFPENRPTFAEVLERIEEVGYAEEDHATSSVSSANQCHEDCCVLHSIISEAWDTPGSNY